MIYDKKWRSLLKTISWNFIAFLATTISVLIFTGSLKIAGTVGIFDRVLKFVLYYFHERQWNSVEIGRYED